MKNVLLLLLLTTTICASDASYMGTYRITKFIDSAMIGTRESAKEERSLIGKTVEVREDYIKVN